MLAEIALASKLLLPHEAADHLAVTIFLAGTSIVLGAPAVDAARAEAVITRCVSIYHEPVDGKSHPCACPFDHMKNGRLCGRVSAHDRPGGAAPVCLITEVTPDMLRDAGTNEQGALRERCRYHGR